MNAARNIRTRQPEENEAQALAVAVKTAGRGVSHNLNGQKLGKKGRGTRDRILAATVDLLASTQDETISMSAVARKASLGMTSLYNYFTDFTELLLAVLEPVMDESEGAFLVMLRERWPNAELSQRCGMFVDSYHAFWARHSRLLHLRNSMSDNRDERMTLHRIRATQPIIALLAAQMGDDPESQSEPALGMATVLMTGIERTITMATDNMVTKLIGSQGERQAPDHYLRPAARLLEIAIRDMRGQFQEKSKP